MKRRKGKARADWVNKVEDVGLVYHHTQGKPYWDESVYYEFTAKEVDVLEAATNELQRICLLAGQKIIDDNRFAEFGIPQLAWQAITDTWITEPPAIYGRMDLAYNGYDPPKLLEYNADTPTALLESAVVQWYWLEEVHKGADQFNSIHERLVAKWKELRGYLDNVLYFAHLDDPQGEDTMTANYLRDTASQAGFDARGILVRDIGWDGKEFVDMQNRAMRAIFKLYPWEWMMHEGFGPHAIETMNVVNWVEPIWKMLWSNKAILPLLWEMFPNHPNLLPAYFDGPRDLKEWIRKPKMSREGANVTVHSSDGPDLTTGGDYGEEGFVYQELASIFHGEGQYAVLGSWVIDGESGGMGIRESDGPVTRNESRFVPHLFS